MEEEEEKEKEEDEDEDEDEEEEEADFRRSFRRVITSSKLYVSACFFLLPLPSPCLLLFLDALFLVASRSGPALSNKL